MNWPTCRRYLGRGGAPPDLSRHDVRIFAEIVDAPLLPLDRLLARAETLRAQGADVIDLGCRPGTPFDHLEAAIARLHDAGHRVSVDSGNLDELRRGALAGADFLLSLTEDSLDVAAGTSCRSGAGSQAARRPGFPGARRRAPHRRAACPACSTRSSTRSISASPPPCCATRPCAARLPQAEILMGTGNLTELTDADSSGVTAMLIGICSELAIRNVLVVQVSPHTRETVAEHDFARRLMFAARANGGPAARLWGRAVAGA